MTLLNATEITVVATGVLALGQSEQLNLQRQQFMDQQREFSQRQRLQEREQTR